MRVVLDTNVFVSAILGGRLGIIIDRWKEGRFDLVVSDDLVREYAEVLIRPKFGLPPDVVEGIIGYVLHKAEFVVVTESVRVVEADPADDKFLAAASTARADFLVSGDGHLLDIGTWDGVPILSPRDFLGHLGGQLGEP